MKYIVLIFFFLLAAFVVPYPIYAHALGLPPFFKINGTIAISSPLQTVRTIQSGFESAQDVAHTAFMVGEPILFNIDTNILQSAYPADIFKKMEYDWDFGDSNIGTGEKNVHFYSKPGSYILSVNANYGDDVISQEPIESVVLNILPDKNYKLPKAKIKINGKTLKDPLKDSHSFDLQQELTFDASGSIAPSSKIVEYIWDFGDGTTSNEPITVHRYSKAYSYITPTLRIRDEQNLLSYAFADIITFNDKSKAAPLVSDAADTSRDKSLGMFMFFPLAVLFFVVIMLPGVVGSIKKKKK